MIVMAEESTEVKTWNNLWLRGMEQKAEKQLYLS